MFSRILYFWLYFQNVCHCISVPLTWSQRHVWPIRSYKLTHSPNTHSRVWLLWHLTMTYYSCGSLIHSRCFLVPCGLSLYSLHRCKPPVGEWTVQGKLFVILNIDYKIIITCTDYEIVTKWLYHWKCCCNPSGTYYEGLYNYDAGFSTSP
jgi:hypothetical protein